MVFGTFDVLHPGHEYFLKESKKHGDELIVVIARDLTVKEIKGKLPLNNELKRLNAVKKLKYVDKALLGNLRDKYRIIEDIKPDVICLGYDQNSFTANLKNELKKRALLIDIYRILPYRKDKFKSSKLK